MYLVVVAAKLIYESSQVRPAEIFQQTSRERNLWWVQCRESDPVIRQQGAG